MLKFSYAVFDDLMSVIALEVVENDWKCAACEVKFAVTFVAESAAKGSRDVAMVAHLFVCGVVKC